MTPSQKEIYRKDFIASQGQKNGDILIPASLNIRAFTSLCFFIVVAIFLFIFHGEYTRKVKLEGVVMPSTGIIKITTNTDGQIIHTFVKEGDNVYAGDKLYQISGEQYDQFGKGMLASMSESLSKQTVISQQQYQQGKKLISLKLNALKDKEIKLILERKSSRSTLQLAISQSKLKTFAEQRFETLAKKGFVSELDFQQKQIEVVIANENIEEKRLALLHTDRELLDIRNELKEIALEVNKIKLDFDGQQQELRQKQVELLTRINTTINSPVDGSIAAVLSKLGQKVSSSTVMLTLVPTDAKLQVELYAPSKAIGFIGLGQNVGLRFTPFPYEKFGIQHGEVVKVSRASLSPVDMVSTVPISLNPNETYYRIIVNLDKKSVTAYGKEEPLLVGMTVSAAVDLDTRYLYEWLLEPLWRLKGNI